MTADRLLERLQDIIRQHGGDIEVGFKNPHDSRQFDEAMFADLKFVDANQTFTRNEDATTAVIVIG